MKLCTLESIRHPVGTWKKRFLWLPTRIENGFHQDFGWYWLEHVWHLRCGSDDDVHYWKPYTSRLSDGPRDKNV